MSSKTKMEFELPEELLHEILVKLPVKSLVRFRCVCKTWYSLITSSDFILSHLHHSNQEYNLLLKQLFSDPKEDITKSDTKFREKYSIHADNDRFQEIETLDFPFNGLSIVGCVNGLVCLRKDDSCTKSNSVMLWNPSIRKYFILPQLEEKPISYIGLNNMCFGFGFDSLSNDFKVVRMIDGFEHLGASDVNLVKVFLLRAKSWRTIDCSPPRGPCYSTCNVGNFVYNLYSIRSGSELEIVSFDLGAEVFARIEFPEDITLDPMYRTINLTKFRDCLALIRREWQGDEYHIWCMRDDGVGKSWSKLFVVNIQKGMVWQSVVGFTAKGRMIVVGYRNVLVSAASEDAHVVKYMPSGHNFRCTSRLELYKESLALLEEGVDIHGSKIQSQSRLQSRKRAR